MTIDDATIAVLIPAFDEERQILGVLQSMPDFVDHVVVVDDASRDRTAEVVEAAARRDPRIHLIRLEQNRGVGGALAVAYAWARDEGVDVAVTVDGDGQMDPSEMVHLITPLLDGRADYTKGNRLSDPRSWRLIPPVRLFGNAVLSFMTKISSGYWAVADSQSGYSAAGRWALENIEWENVYPRYGRPNDVLVRANVADCRVADVPIRPIYGVGERSSMKILMVIFGISTLLFRRFWWRLTRKYLLLEFHPLLFFYLLGGITGLLAVGLAVRMFAVLASDGFIPQMNALAVAFFAITSLNAVFFGFWMDMEANKHLYVRLHDPRELRASSLVEAPRQLSPPAPRDSSGDGAGDGSAAAQSAQLQDAHQQHER